MALNYWKQFAAWVTASKHSVLFKSRLKIALLYFTAILITLTFSNAIILTSRPGEIRTTIGEHQATSTVDHQTLIHLLITDLRQRTLLTHSAVIASSLILSYVFAGLTLRPVTQHIEMQRRFISDASHELNTPLSILKTELELALMRKNDVTREEILATIHSNLDEVNRMTNIIKNLHSFSKLHDTGHNIPFTKVNLDQITHRTIQHIRGLAEEKNIDVQISTSPKPVIWGNETALEQMTLNLLKNAVTYTPRNGHIQVKTEQKNGKVLLSISDTGIGIDKKDLPHIFEPFYKIDRSRKYNKGDHGLGLSIVKKIIYAHQGKVHIHSVPDEGTTVRASFKLAYA